MHKQHIGNNGDSHSTFGWDTDVEADGEDAEGTDGDDDIENSEDMSSGNDVQVGDVDGGESDDEGSGQGPELVDTKRYLHASRLRAEYAEFLKRHDGAATSFQCIDSGKFY